MLGFLKLITAMSLRDHMKPQAKTKQIQNTSCFKFHPSNCIQEHGIHAKASNLRLVLRSFEAG